MGVIRFVLCFLYGSLCRGDAALNTRESNDSDNDVNDPDKPRGVIVQGSAGVQITESMGSNWSHKYYYLLLS